MQNIYFPLFADLNIYIAVHSLKYEAEQTYIKEVTRSQYARMKAEKKTGKAYQNQYFERVTHTKANEIIAQNTRQDIRKEYDKAIMQKYNVGDNYRQNRWFMEQVRPTI